MSGLGTGPRNGAVDIHFLSIKPMLGHGTTELRCVQPAAYLRAAGWTVATGCLWQDMPRARRLLVLHRVPDGPVTRRAIGLARAAGCAVAYDVDDLVFDPDGQAHLAGFGGPSGADLTAPYRTALRAADTVICATDFLRDRAIALHGDCVVMRNGLSQEFLDRAAAAPARAADAPPTLGYFSGSAHHDADFALILPVLLQLLSARPTLHLLIAGKLHVPEALAGFGARVRHQPFLPYRDFIGLIAGIDVNLIPLELDSPFAQARSELKYIEAGAFGVPSVASPTATQRRAIAHGRTGLLADGPGDWEAALTALLDAPGRRRALGAAARADVLENYGPARRQAEWQALVAAVLERHARADRRPAPWLRARHRLGLAATGLRRSLRPGR